MSVSRHPPTFALRYVTVTSPGNVTNGHVTRGRNASRRIQDNSPAGQGRPHPDLRSEAELFKQTDSCQRFRARQRREQLPYEEVPTANSSDNEVIEIETALLIDLILSVFYQTFHDFFFAAFCKQPTVPCASIFYLDARLDLRPSYVSQF